MGLSTNMRQAARRLIRTVPGAELRLRSLVRRRRIVTGVRLLCYAKRKATFEWYRELGAGHGEVDIETLFTAVNVGTERARLYRLPNTFTEFPYTPTCPGVGRIIRIGRGVRGFRRGDIVIGLFKHSSLQRSSANNLLKIEGVDLEAAAVIRLCIVAVQGLRMGRVCPGQRVLVMGQGVIGRLATLVARAEGVEQVICLTRTAEKPRMLGEQEFIATEATAPSDIRGIRADVVIDATGNPDAIHTAVEAAAEGGRVVLLGSSRGPTLGFDTNGPVMQKGLTIVGAHRKNLDMMPREIGGDYGAEVEHIVTLIRAGKLDLSRVITRQIPCEQLADTYTGELFDSPELCGAVVDWTASKRLVHQPRRSLNLAVPCTPRRTGRRLRFGLVGCGGISVANAAAIAGSACAELTVVMDKDVLLAEDLGRKHSVPSTDELDELLSDGSIDAVLIATPHHLHAPLAKQAAEAGKHVLVEKPLATTMDDAEAMIETANANKVLLRTFLARKCKRPFRVARQLMEEDAIGSLMGVAISAFYDQSQAYWTGGRRGRSQSDWRAHRATSGGGVLIMNLVHDLDALRFLTGITIQEVFSHQGALYHPVEVEDTVALTFTGANGEIGTLSASSAVKGGGGATIRLWGENGQMVIGGKDVWFYSLRPVGSYKAQQAHTIRCADASANDARIRCVDNFVLEVSEERHSDFDDGGYQSLAIVMAAYESSTIKRPVVVPEK